MKKLAIVTTHPIQYNAPWFRLLAQRKQVDVKVFYTWSQSKNSVKDRTFGKEITWDIPLLEGYNHEFVDNKSKKPGSHHFFGINCPELIPKLKEFQPDTILFFGWNFKSHLLAMRHFKGKVPVWFRGDSTLINEVNGFKTSLRRIVLKKVYSFVDKALYVGKANKAYFEIHGLTTSQLLYAPHSIDNNRFMGNESDTFDLEAVQWREQLGYHQQDVVILYAGKFEPVKQPELMIKAFQEANATISKSLKLLMVGNGPLEVELKERVKNDENIQFLDFQNQSQMPIVYRLGTIFCLPSKSETWGLAINEAMACGRPVIVSNKVGCAEDLVVSESNGYIFEHNSQTALATIFKTLSLPILKEMGKNAQTDIQSYSFHAIVNAVETELATL